MKKLFLLLLAVMPLTAPAQWLRTRPLDDATKSQLQKFDNFYMLLSNTYIDSIPDRQLIEKAIKGVLAELDPHSVYLSTEELKQSNEQFQGNFGGIGIEFNILKDTLIIVNTVAGGPSDKVGILPNDKIVAIDGVSSIGISREEAPRKLRGPKGTPVVLTIVRHGAPEPLEFRIIRDDIPITTIDASYNVNQNIGYVRVNKFAQNTMDEFRQSVRNMGPVESLILDLRGNGGGFLHMAIDMSNYFLNRNDLIVSTEGMRVPSQEYRATRNGEFHDGKVVVLIDELSASASEIVAGAMQDWDRAVIVGRRSFGKGLVQQQFPLQDSSAVRITIARYLTPTGRAIQRPFEMGHSEEYYQRFAERVSDASNDAGGANALNETAEKYKTLRLGKTVYGGGGIYPDYYVPADTTGYSDYLAQLLRMGVFNEFIASYLERNRTRLEALYPDFESFNREFTVGGDIIGEFTALGETRGVAMDAEGLAISDGFIRTQLKGMIAGQLWGTSAFYEFINAARDPIFHKALEVLENWDEMSAGIATDHR